jgi:hypothetical protein
MSKEDIHSISYTPKPKIRNSQDWIQNSDSGSKHSSRSESPNEHWLVEEAERRRKISSLDRFSRWGISSLGGLHDDDVSNDLGLKFESALKK